HLPRYVSLTGLGWSATIAQSSSTHRVESSADNRTKVRSRERNHMPIRPSIVFEAVLVVIIPAHLMVQAASGEQNTDSRTRATSRLLTQVPPDATRNVPAVNAAAVRQRVQIGTVAGEKTVVRGDVGVRKIEATAKETELHANEYVVARWAEKEVKIAPIATPNGAAWSAGFGFISVAPDGRELRFRPVIESAGGPALTAD